MFHHQVKDQGHLPIERSHQRLYQDNSSHHHRYFFFLYYLYPSQMLCHRRLLHRTCQACQISRRPQRRRSVLPFLRAENIMTEVYISRKGSITVSTPTTKEEAQGAPVALTFDDSSKKFDDPKKEFPQLPTKFDGPPNKSPPGFLKH